MLVRHVFAGTCRIARLFNLVVLRRCLPYRLTGGRRRTDTRKNAIVLRAHVVRCIERRL